MKLKKKTKGGRGRGEGRKHKHSSDIIYIATPNYTTKYFYYYSHSQSRPAEDPSLDRTGRKECREETPRHLRPPHAEVYTATSDSFTFVLSVV